MATSIEVDDVFRSYRGQRGAPDVEALRGISFRVETGEFFGILGPNGAGKTTLIRILSTLLTPTRGTAKVEGCDVVRSANEVRRGIGVVFGGERGLYDRLSAWDNLAFAAHLYGIPTREQRVVIPRMLERVDLSDKARSRVETFSRGMRQRLHIARALIHDPDVILLDEPSSGLDPVAARSLRDLVRELNSSGKTIVLTTHYMFEADELCDRLVVVADGQIVREGTPSSIKSSVHLGRVLELEVFGGTTDQVDEVRKIAGVSAVDVVAHQDRNKVVVRMRDDSSLTLPHLIELFHGQALGSAVERGPTLEDAYVSIVEAAGELKPRMNR